MVYGCRSGHYADYLDYVNMMNKCQKISADRHSGLMNFPLLFFMKLERL